MRHFLFSEGSSNQPDETFQDQYDALKNIGFSVSTVSDSVLRGREHLCGIPVGSTVVYRGWMLSPEEYAFLEQAIRRAEATPITTTLQYLNAHYLPNWYPLIADLTAQTEIISLESDLVAELRKLDWNGYFIKDYVKSLKTGVGSIIDAPEEVLQVVEELRESRRKIEGGICVRKVERYWPGSERRNFVIDGIAYAPNGGATKAIVDECADIIKLPFFSVDIAERHDGELRVIEIGDGQVSDIVGWTAEDFAKLWKKCLNPLSS